MAELRVGHDHRRQGRRCHYVRIANRVAEDGHLAEEVTRTKVGQVLVAANDFAGPVLDHEELVAEATCAHEALAGLDVDLIRLPSDLRELILRQALKQPDSLQMLYVHW